MKLLPKGFAQLLPIVQVIVSLHLEYILQAARGTLASGSGAPSEEKALECVLRMFEGRHGEADKEALEAYLRARTHEWWADYPERQLLSTLVRRADLRKQGIGEKDDRRHPDLKKRVSRLPGRCWPASRKRSRWTLRGNTNPCRSSWRPS